jgi:hypothetical protein
MIPNKGLILQVIDQTFKDKLPLSPFGYNDLPIKIDKLLHQIISIQL